MQDGSTVIIHTLFVSESLIKQVQLLILLSLYYSSPKMRTDVWKSIKLEQLKH